LPSETPRHCRPSASLISLGCFSQDLRWRSSGYGYQWWTGTVDWEGKKLAWSAGFGNGGQRLFVVPELDLTVVITAGAYNDPQIGRAVTEIFRQIVATVRS